MDTLAIVKRIEMRLSEIGMSKAEFYSKSGISSASFSQWRTGTYKPSTKKLENAATALGISYDYLLNGLYRSDVTSFANGITVFKGSSQQEIEHKVNALEVGSYRVVFRSPGVVITADNNSSATDEQINNIIAIYSIHEEPKKASTISGERSVSDDELKFALWGECEDIGDDDLADVLRYAAFVRERKKDKK